MEVSPASTNGSSASVPAAIDGPISLFELLLQASDIERFLIWMKEHHHQVKIGRLFSGYKFLLDAITKVFMDKVYKDSALELTEDEILFRAQFKGIPLSDTPNSCEKTVLLKRIWIWGKAFARSKGWEELRQASIRFKEDLSPLAQIWQGHIATKSDLGKDRVLQAIQADHVFTFLNDSSHNIPLAELTFPSVISTATEKSLSDAFPGYVYGLEYLWYLILGKEEFEHTPVRDIHLALNKEEARKHPREMGLFEKMLEGRSPREPFRMKRVKPSELDEEARDFLESVKRDRPVRSKRWEALDRFYRPIQNEIVRPREAHLGVTLGMSHLLVLQDYEKGLLGDLLEPRRVLEADYLPKTDRNSLKKRLSLALLWYDLNVLDTQALLVFNGVPAFASTLLGSLELAKSFNRKDPVKTIIFKHPAGWEDHFDYSFGVFIQAYGQLWSDYSGWLIFYDCATDHSGFGESLFAHAKRVIEIGKGIGPLEVSEMVVERALFKEYLKEHSVSSVFDALIKETPGGTKEIGTLDSILGELSDFTSKSKGKLFEHVVRKWVVESQGFEGSLCDAWLDGEQMDCIGTKKGKITLFECKLDVHRDTVAATIAQVKRKLAAISGREQEVEAHLMVYSPITRALRVRFEREGIFVTDDFRKIISEDRCFARSRDETIGILDWRFRTPGRLRPDY